MKPLSIVLPQKIANAMREVREPESRCGMRCVFVLVVEECGRASFISGR